MGRRGFLSPARGVAAPKKVQGFHLLRPMPGLPWPALDAATQANLWPTKSAIISMPARDADVMVPALGRDGAPRWQGGVRSCNQDGGLAWLLNKPCAHLPQKQTCLNGLFCR